MRARVPKSLRGFARSRPAACTTARVWRKQLAEAGLRSGSVAAPGRNSLKHGCRRGATNGRGQLVLESIRCRGRNLLRQFRIGILTNSDTFPSNAAGRNSLQHVCRRGATSEAGWSGLESFGCPMTRYFATQVRAWYVARDRQSKPGNGHMPRDATVRNTAGGVLQHVTGSGVAASRNTLQHGHRRRIPSCWNRPRAPGCNRLPHCRQRGATSGVAGVAESQR
jgi:hypothetical protein